MASLQRIVRGRSATLTHTFYSDATAADPSPDITTVTITRADGTAVVTGATATEAGTGVVTYTVTPAQTALLDRWTVTWTATFGGQSQPFVSYVEVAGDVLFTIAEARAIQPLNNTTTYTTADVVATRVMVEQALEDACGVAFVPRYELETIDATGGGTVLLRWPKVRAIRSGSYTTSGTVTALTSGDLAALAYSSAGIVGGYTFTAGYGNVTVGYEHGHSAPPLEIKRAALLLTKMWMVGLRNPIDDRAITFNTTDGGTYSLAVPGRNGSYFGHPDVDAAIDRYSMRVGIA